jgi:hypothetical protein
VTSVGKKTYLCTFQVSDKTTTSYVLHCVRYFNLSLTRTKNGYSIWFIIQVRAIATLHAGSTMNSTYQHWVWCLCPTKCKPSHVECNNNNKNSVNGKWNTVTVLKNKDSCTRTDKSRYAVGPYTTTEGKITQLRARVAQVNFNLKDQLPIPKMLSLITAVCSNIPSTNIYNVIL